MGRIARAMTPITDPRDTATPDRTDPRVPLSKAKRTIRRNRASAIVEPARKVVDIAPLSPPYTSFHLTRYNPLRPTRFGRNKRNIKATLLVL